MYGDELHDRDRSVFLEVAEYTASGERQILNIVEGNNERKVAFPGSNFRNILFPLWFATKCSQSICQHILFPDDDTDGVVGLVAFQDLSFK